MVMHVHLFCIQSCVTVIHAVSGETFNISQGATCVCHLVKSGMVRQKQMDQWTQLCAGACTSSCNAYRAVCSNVCCVW